VKLFRWRGVFGLLFLFALVGIWWLIFGERTVRNTLQEAATTSLGTQVDIGSVDVQLTRGSVILNGVAVADPFDSLRNLLEAGDARVELELEPLLTKKIVVRDLQVHGLRAGTRRAVPARPVDTSGFVPRALREIQRFREQIDVPLLSLTPIDTIRSIVLDPTQLRTVRSAIALQARAESLSTGIVARAQTLARTDVLDSAEALLGRLRGQTVRSLGITGTIRAVRDVRRLTAEVDSLRRGAEELRRLTTRSFDSVLAATRAVDDARRADYDFARGLLALPTFDAPSIGPALFGDLSVTTFEKATYWVGLAREYAPPGLVPRQRPGARRARAPGTTVNFVAPESGPDFLLRAADLSVAIGDAAGAARGDYALSLRDLTTAPALLGRPTGFSLSRRAEDTDLPELHVSGTLDHTGATPHDVVRLAATDFRLPEFALPGIPLTLDLNRGSSELRFEMRGDDVAARLSIRANAPRWLRDSTRARELHPLEALVVRVLERVGSLHVEAELTGTLRAPRLSVSSSIDREVAAAVRGVLGEAVQAAEARVRAQVDSIAEEKLAPVRARAVELRGQAEARVNEANARIEAVRERLLAQLRALGG
jgi:uncharacterized protein (TIGR03545 family)